MSIIINISGKECYVPLNIPLKVEYLSSPVLDIIIVVILENLKYTT